MTTQIKIGDSRFLIKELQDKSIDCVVTSPPYFGLRDYKTEPIIFEGLSDCEHEWSNDIVRKTSNNYNNGFNERWGNSAGQKKQEQIAIGEIKQGTFCLKCGAWRGQLGLEPTPELFIKHLLDFFDDVKLKLKDEGNCFVNIGDTYSGSKVGNTNGVYVNGVDETKAYATTDTFKKKGNLPSKCLCMIPQRFAWGMIERGWILRNEIVWAKPNHMPESVTDRLTKAHEVVWHFVQQGKYYYNLDAIRESHKTTCSHGKTRKITAAIRYGATSTFNGNGDHDYNPLGANPSDVWNITTQPYPESHFAVFPLELVRRPILAGCPVGGTVLDPFAGSGTVGEFCRHNNRNAVLFELNPEYGKLIKERSMANIPELMKWL